MSELDVAKKTAKEAGKILLSYFFDSKTGVISSKGEIDKVTDADKKSEHFIRKTIKASFPNHKFIGEEFGETEEVSDCTWYVDPLCGTFNFIHNLPEFAISIGLDCKKEIILGVVYVPVLDELFWAEKGKGAFINGKKITVSKVSLISNAMLSSDFGSNPESRLRQLNFMTKVIPKCEYLRIGGSFPYQLTRLALGKIDGHFEVEVPIVHRAASMIIVTEAGGRVTNLKNQPSTILDNDIVSSNGIIHNNLIDILSN